MPVKLIISDLDGTLLKEDKTLSEYTVETLKACRKKGIKVAFATGRGAKNDKVVPKELFDVRIKANGAQAKVGDEIVYCRKIPYELVKPFLEVCQANNFKLILQAADKSYANFKSSSLFNNGSSELIDILKHNIDADKILFRPVDVDFVEKHLPDDLHYTVSRENFISIMHKEATKAKALSAAAKFLGINPPEIAAFGDDLNDIDMLAFAGIGIAMGNAVDKLKAIADDTTLSNDEDGVAHWLERNLLLKGE